MKNGDAGEKRYLFAEVDGNIGDSQRHQKADERPVGAEGWKLHHSTSRDDRARGICLGLGWLEGKPKIGGWEAVGAPVFSSRNGR